MPTSSESSGGTNAERVRENQRRSRAKKREYVVSLEQRLRRCHEAGVKANVRLQEAAKRVVDENRDLRNLLRRQGLSDQEIQAQLSMLRSTPGAEALPTVSIRNESRVTPHLDSRAKSPDSSESLFTGMNEAWTDTPSYHDGEGFLEQLNADAIFAPPAVDPLWDLGSEINLSDLPYPPILQADEYTSPILSNSSPSEMDMCCSAFLRPHTTGSFHPGAPGGSHFLPPPTSSQAASCSTNITGGRSSSTPCAVAYALLTALNERRRQQQDMLLITLELLNGFHAAPEGDPEGCRVDNAVLIPVMGKLLTV